jgi:hypothetical protein
MALTTVNPALLDTQAQYTGFKNRLINGGMVISQRVGTTATTVGLGSQYGLDRWRLNSSQASKISFQQQTIASPPSCGNNRFTMNVTSLAATTVGASDYYGFNQFVEAFNMQDLGWGTSGAQTVTFSFWVYASVTGTYSGAIRTGDSANYSFPFTYAISVANTWEYKTVAIPGPTAGTWGTGNSVGLDVWFSLGTGSTFKGTAGAWAAANYVGATGEVALVNTSGATFYITGVQLEKGSTATSFDYRPYGTEEILCQRYLPAFISTSTNDTLPGSFFGATSTAASGAYVFMVRARVRPTGITVSAGSHFTLTRPSTGTVVATGVNYAAAGTDAAQLEFTAASGLAADQSYFVRSNSASARILFTGCEL